MSLPSLNKVITYLLQNACFYGVCNKNDDDDDDDDDDSNQIEIINAKKHFLFVTLHRINLFHKFFKWKIIRSIWKVKNNFIEKWSILGYTDTLTTSKTYQIQLK